MKKIFILLTIVFTTSVFARELYPESIVRLPSKAYKIELLKDIKMFDKRRTIFFHQGQIVRRLPKTKDLFFCKLENIRSDGTVISLKKETIFRFSDKSDESTYWESFMSGRIWQSRWLFWDNGDVQYFSCNNTAKFINFHIKEVIDYRKIKSAVGRYLKITINE